MADYLKIQKQGYDFFAGLRPKKWLVGTNTADTTGPSFKTKREALDYGREHIRGIFFVWKNPLAIKNKTGV